MASLQHFWFTDDPQNKETSREQACWCDHCCSHIFASPIIATYGQKGLVLIQGQKVTKAMVLQAWNLLSDRIKELCDPCPLEVLAAHAVYVNTPIDDLHELPLPELITDRLVWHVYERKFREHTFEKDYSYDNKGLKCLPGILWDHVGKFLILDWWHPYPL